MSIIGPDRPALRARAAMSQETVSHDTEMALGEGFGLEQDLFAITCGTEDFKEPG